jgi:hypothetical protein
LILISFSNFADCGKLPIFFLFQFLFLAVQIRHPFGKGLVAEIEFERRGFLRGKVESCFFRLAMWRLCAGNPAASIDTDCTDFHGFGFNRCQRRQMRVGGKAKG